MFGRFLIALLVMISHFGLAHAGAADCSRTYTLAWV